MYCPKCATENRDEAKFCRECGYKLTVESGKEPVKRAPFEKFFKWVGIIVVVLFVLGTLSNF